MRHVATLIAAIVIAPLAWILLALGQERSVQLTAASTHHGSSFLRPVLVLAAAGILFGLIATLRFSPLGAVVTGAAYAISYLALLFVPNTVLRMAHHSFSISGHTVDTSTPIRNGTTMLLGGLLLMAIFSVSRWRRQTDSLEESWSSTDSSRSTDRGWSSGGGSGFGGGGSGYGGGGSGFGTEPETQGRYSHHPQSASVGASSSGSAWVDSLRSGRGV
jgi:uncharacterized membrane protein YgcG